jgi:hypothetical protein
MLSSSFDYDRFTLCTKLLSKFKDFKNLKLKNIEDVILILEKCEISQYSTHAQIGFSALGNLEGNSASLIFKQFIRLSMYDSIKLVNLKPIYCKNWAKKTY